MRADLKHAMREGAADARARAMMLPNASNAQTGENVIARLFASLGHQVIDDMDAAAQEDEAKREEAAQREQLVGARYKGAGVPTKFLTAELSDIKRLYCVNGVNGAVDMKDINLFMDGISHGRDLSMWMCGAKGMGKTALACAIMHELVRRGVECRYYKSYEIMQRLDDAKCRASRESKRSIMAEVCNAQFRVIDEIGRYPAQDAEKFMLFQVINDCYDAKHSAIYISNTSRSEFAEYIGEAAADRFKGQGLSLEFIGKSLRGTAGELYREAER